jgi:multisubunit Na+/H+ antiporter MnhF subunit
VNGWLWGATVLVAGLLPLLPVAARAGLLDGLVALQVAGTNTTIALLLIAQGTGRQGFGDLAIAAALAGFTANVAFARFMERPDR